MKRVAVLVAVLGALAASAQPAGAATACTSPQLNTDQPAQSVLSTFGVLRRPARPTDSWPRTDLLDPDESYNQNWFRRAGSLAGYSFFVLPGHKATPCGSPPELYVGALGRFSTVNGAVSLSTIRHFGFWFGQGFSGGSIVSGLLPDGVAKVRVTFPKGRSHPGGVKYKRAVRRTVRVHNNVALFRLARPPADATPSHQVWFSKSGRVIRRARGNP
jgi:hypothetical protein